MRKDRIDLAGAAGLVLVSVILGTNQIAIKLTGSGIAPVYQVALRSVGAVLVLAVWMAWRRVPFRVNRRTLGPGLVLGVFFAVEFVALFLALDLTSVSRASIIFYSMPVHLSLAANFLLPGERLTRQRVLGLVLAMAGVVVVMADRGGGEASLLGDVLALVGALGWAGIALLVRISPLQKAYPEEQLMWQILVSAPLLLIAAPLFGPMLRDIGWIHLPLMAFQVLLVSTFVFLLWFHLLRVYPASNVASFSFLAPVVSVTLAWLALGEPMHLSVLAALALVAAGIFLINRG
ncbi:DMT family transporter [Pseudooceanicola aestuarii]|uniref:DMT family transporter n=1 Tax=Pseudooceanicola aestuarii TaxID=2697319 RepID=UPI0013D23548|nr:DMT family transporter [Pseudooceanicola aestuarii]